MDNILYRSDCQEALKLLINEGVRVDLIYIDPPFNSSRTYNMVYSNVKDKNATKKAFHDMWLLTSQNQQMVLRFEGILDSLKGISQLVKDFLKAWVAPLKNGNIEIEDQKMLVYLIYMTERLVLMKQILKPTGSIYFHCDPTASHYIKIIMDGIFGRKNFRREITWSNEDQSGYKSQARNWIRGNDSILYYVISKQKFVFNKEYKPLDEKTVRRYDKVNEDGRRYKIYRNKDGSERRSWLKVDRGASVSSVWSDIPSFQKVNNTGEFLGYPTQKPIALLNRIIKASSNEGDIVLDPFCGCGTALASAIRNKRKWIGVDISYDAIDIIKKRIKPLLFDFDVTYEQRDGSPETVSEYNKPDAYQKQDWLIQKLGGFPNP